MSAARVHGPRVALIIDNPYRDLPGLVLVAWELCQRGVTCFLVPMNLQTAEVVSLAPDCVLLNYLRKNNESTARMYMTSGMTIGVHDTEGSIFSALPMAAVSEPGRFQGDAEGRTLPAMEVHALEMAQDPDVRARVACYCAWTTEFAEYFSRTGRYRRDQFVITGTPRVDYYAGEWRDAALGMAPDLRRYPEPRILLNGTFPLANPRFQTPAQELADRVERATYDRDFAVQWQKTQSIVMHGMASLANHLARSFPAATIVYRPHPFESTDRYEPLLEPHPNLHLVKEGTVDAWLLSAKALIHWECSTAIEGGLAGIPVFTPGWFPVHLPVPVVDEVSIWPSTEADLTEQIGNVLDGTFEVPVAVRQTLDRSIQQLYFRVDGKSHVRVADAILKSLEGKTDTVSLGKCKEFARTVNGGSREWEMMIASWKDSEKHFSVPDVERMVAVLAAVAPGSRSLVSTTSAQESGAYRFEHPFGVSVVMRPASQASPSLKEPDLASYPHLLGLLDGSLRG